MMKNLAGYMLLFAMCMTACHPTQKPLSGKSTIPPEAQTITDIRWKLIELGAL